MRGTPLQETHRPRPNGIIPAYAGNTPDVARRACLSGDHPRVCGEHPLWLSRSRFGVGSSPRMRGTLCRCCRTRFRLGIIPAYVGNTDLTSGEQNSTRDHPRVCGEHGEIDVCMAGNMGSSPRMRGTRQERVERRGRLGIIPAYAGNTRRESTAAQYPEDHPRVCGEHFHSWFGTVHGLGSSPRMRGTRNINPRRTFRMGIIPAYAGNTGRDRIRLHPPRDHPRVCGEHHGAVEPRNCHPGSSPRMRGTRQLVGWRTPESGIIPAYAGNTRAQPASLPANWDHPRVCGEHSTSSKPPDVMSGSSPRMRGTRSWRDCRAARAGIIPAYAGNTCDVASSRCAARDHPRVCGEH